MVGLECKLTPEQLRRTVVPESLGISTTEHLQPLAWIIGQSRAVSSLQFGLAIQEPGFHIYVAGPSGSGKMTAVRTFLEEVARSKEPPADWCYVYNFNDPYQPTVCRLPSGQGRQFQEEMRQAIEYIHRELPTAFESEEYASKQEEIGKTLEKERSQFIARAGERARQNGFALQATPVGLVLVPVLGGRPAADAELQNMPAAAVEDFQRRREILYEEFKSSLRQIREIERAAQKQLEALDRQTAQYILGGLIEDLTAKYGAQSETASYLKAVKQDILSNLEPFKAPRPTASERFHDASSSVQELLLHKYAVNVLVDNSKQVGAPVIIEINPTYNNLFGRLEKEPQFGTLYTDFTMIKAGALHRANGGYLVLPAEGLMRDPVSWEGLKRALRSREIHLEEVAERMGFPAIKSLRPQPVPLDVKVILVGSRQLYYLLYAQDEDFSELCKVKADFDTNMEWNDENVQDFLRFLCTLCCKEGLSHMNSSAVAKVLEHALRLAEDQTKLSTQFGTLADLVREAHFWARQEGVPFVSAAHVCKAIDEKIARGNLIQRHIQEMIYRGTLLIETTGQAVGQVNGLSIISLGDSLFGRPNRITASVGPGREGILDIEREVRLGGPLHSKGILILSGYLAQRYAQDKPLTLAARLVFEQSYEGVEGDSASSAELYALLSALSGVPIRQGIAVTGSVNQRGDVERTRRPAFGGIRGVSEKLSVRGTAGAGEDGPRNPVRSLSRIVQPISADFICGLDIACQSDVKVIVDGYKRRESTTHNMSLAHRIE